MCAHTHVHFRSVWNVGSLLSLPLKKATLWSSLASYTKYFLQKHNVFKYIGYFWSQHCFYNHINKLAVSFFCFSLLLLAAGSVSLCLYITVNWETWLCVCVGKWYVDTVHLMYVFASFFFLITSCNNMQHSREWLTSLVLSLFFHPCHVFAWRSLLSSDLTGTLTSPLVIVTIFLAGLLPLWL